MKLWLWRGASLLVFAGITAMLVWAVREWRADRRMFADAKTLAATVIATDYTEQATDVQTRRGVTVRFDIGNVRYTKRIDIVSEIYNEIYAGLALGSAVSVVYRADDPYAVYVAHPETQKQVMQGYTAKFIIGGLLWVLCAFWLYAAFFMRR